MQPIGYLYKRIAARPEWLRAPGVADVFSLSACISENFADYLNCWQHNGYWLFDSPAIASTVAAQLGIPLTGLTLFYYEAHELQYDDRLLQWVAYSPEASLPTRVEPPHSPKLEGFDVVSFSTETLPECSPLSCNAVAAALATNIHCLLPTFEAAKLAIEAGRFKDTEPGPLRIVAVYSL
jgi:hypothetical protein